MHDPARGPSVRRAGVQARAARPPPLTPEEAELVRVRHPSEVPATLERIARWAATGRLDTRTANVLVLAATNAPRAWEAAEEARKAEDERRDREARKAEAAKARAEWEASPEGQLEKRALAELDAVSVRLLAQQAAILAS